MLRPPPRASWRPDEPAAINFKVRGAAFPFRPSGADLSAALDGAARRRGQGQKALRSRSLVVVLRACSIVSYSA